MFLCSKLQIFFPVFPPKISWTDFKFKLLVKRSIFHTTGAAAPPHENTKITDKHVLNHTLALLTHSMTLGFLTVDTGFKELYYGLMRNWLECSVADP